MSEAEKAVSAALAEGELLAWSGRPQGGIHLVSFNAFVLLVVLALSVLPLGGAVLALGPPYLLPICWVAVAGALFHFVFGRALIAEVQRGHTFYGLTPRRAIIVFGVLSRQIWSIELASLREISVSERPDHSGTISLGAPPAGVNVRPTGLRGLFWPGPSPNLLPAFERIEKVRTVYDKLVEHQSKHAGG